MAPPLIGEYYLRSATPDLLRMASSRLPEPPDATKRRSKCKWRFGSRSSLNIIRGWHGSETEKIAETAVEIMKPQHAVNLQLSNRYSVGLQLNSYSAISSNNGRIVRAIAH